MAVTPIVPGRPQTAGTGSGLGSQCRHAEASAEEVRPRWGWRLGIGVLVLLAAGCAGVQTSEDPVTAVMKPIVELPDDAAKMIEPSNDRDWSPDQALLPYAEFHGNQVTVHNVRYCTYRARDDYDVEHYDKTFDLDKVQTLDLIVIPFQEVPALAHLAMSFGFEGGDYLGVSVEIRKEKGEKYAPLEGMLRQYELMYVLADERDMIRLRTDHLLSGVYLYRTVATPEEARALFVDVMERVNQLARQPEFYHTFTNNCTTNIIRHVNRLGHGRIPYGYQALLPGYFDRLAYDLGILDTDVSFEETRLRARVNRQVYLYADRPDFSVRIRE